MISVILERSVRFSHSNIMGTAITIKDLLFFLLAAGGIALIVYLIVLVSNRIRIIKLNNIALEKVGTIISTAAEGAESQDLSTDEKNLLKQQVKKVLYFLLL